MIGVRPRNTFSFFRAQNFNSNLRDTTANQQLQFKAQKWSRRVGVLTLSPRERAGVRGKGASLQPMPRIPAARSTPPSFCNSVIATAAPNSSRPLRVAPLGSSVGSAMSIARNSPKFFPSSVGAAQNPSEDVIRVPFFSSQSQARSCRRTGVLMTPAGRVQPGVILRERLNLSVESRKIYQPASKNQTTSCLSYENKLLQ